MALLLVMGLALPALARTAAPAHLTVKPLPSPEGQTALALQWDVVPGAVGYEVLQWRGGRWWFNPKDVDRIPMTSSTTIAGLSPGTTYRFCVRTVGSDGSRSKPSAPVQATTLTMQASVPSGTSQTPATTAGSSINPEAPPPAPPLGLIAVFSAQDQITLSWTPVRGATAYFVEERRDGRWVPCQHVVGSHAASTVVIKDHPSPGPYSFRVRAVGANGKSSSPSFPAMAQR